MKHLTTALIFSLVGFMAGARVMQGGQAEATEGQKETYATQSTELQIIEAAGRRNGCTGDDLVLLLAIRHAENGPDGTEFGVMHPAAKGRGLDIQAGWAAASIMNAHKRHPNLSGRAFIQAMGARYCPPTAHPLNKNWVPNVWHWYQKIKETSP